MSLISKSKILERGWTEGLMNKFLKDIDPELRINPFYKSAPPMKMYEEGLIQEIEETPEFQEALVKSERRKKSAQKAIETKKKTTFEQTQKAIQDIHVKLLDADKLRSNTFYHIRQHNYERDDYDSNPEEASEETIQRWMVNYIRHCLTQYDKALDANFGKVGSSKAYLKLKLAVLDKIAEAYPYLKGECNRQKQRLKGYLED